MKTIVGGCLLVALLWAIPGAASLPDEAVGPPDRFSAYLRLGGFYFDNFFQTAEGGPEDNVLALSLEAGIAYRLQEGGHLEAYLDSDHVRYQDFDPSSGITGGLRAEGKPHSFDVFAQLLKGRPSREVGDVLDRADVFALNGKYSYRIAGDYEVIGQGEFRHETFDLGPDKENDVFNLGGALRYRGFGWRFSPESGLGFGKRDVQNDNEDLSQHEAYLRLRLSPTRSLYLNLRLRQRWRDYTVENASASNFQREDTRRQLVFSGDWTRGKHVVWNLYYAFEDSDSTRASGRFKTQMLFLGLTYRF